MAGLIDDRAERPTGLLASLKALASRLLAEQPTHPIAWSPPRGLDEINASLAEISAASSKAVGPANPVAKLSTGYEYRAVPADAWAHAANLDPDVAACAWALASEAPPIAKFPQYAWAIAEAICNAADGSAWGASKSAPVRYRVCADRRAEVAGHFGRQGGRWCSSFQPPTGKHVRCAELVVTRHRRGEANILARGATQWLDCSVQVAMNKKRPETNPTPEVIVARRYGSGRAWIGPVVDVTGEVLIDPYVLTLFGPTGASLASAQDMVKDGRRRWRQPA